MPTLSVIVCTYNREASLCRTLADLLAQDRAAEIIVVDQTPTHAPATSAFLSAHADAVRVLRVGEPNLPAARNVGLHAASGDIAVFLDDDVRVGPRFLSEILAEFADPSVSAVAPRVMQETPDAAWDPGMSRVARALHRLAGGTARRRVRSCVGACMAFRRAPLLAIGGFDPLVGRLNPTATTEDTECTRRFTTAGYALWYVPSIVVRHVSAVAGGAGNRMGPHAHDMSLHERGHAYLRLKEEDALERLTPRAALRLARLTAFRRDVLLAGPRATWRGLRRVRPLFEEIRDFVANERQSGRAVVDRQHDGAPL